LVPKSLKVCFVIHFFADMIFAIPMMISPMDFLSFWGIENGDSLTVRLVSAALIGIGGNSMIMRNRSLAVYQSMLNLKILWSVSAIIGIILSLVQSGPYSLYFFLSVFFSFSCIWIYYRIRLKNAHQ